MSLSIFGCSSTAHKSCSTTSQENWLIGEWVFDSEATKANFQQGDSEAFMDVLLMTMKDMSFKISKDTMIATRSGEETVSKYTLVEQSDSNALVTKDEAGKTTTYRKDGSQIWVVTEGDMQAKIFLKPITD